MVVTMSAEGKLHPVVRRSLKQRLEGLGAWTDIAILAAGIVLAPPAFLLGLLIYMARKLRPA